MCQELPHILVINDCKLFFIKLYHNRTKPMYLIVLYGVYAYDVYIWSKQTILIKSM